MTTTKTVNYTAEQTAEIVARYSAGEAVDAIAEAFGKTVRSIVAKLSREGVYIAKAKAGAKDRVTKAELVRAIAIETGADEEKLDSLEKATREALEIVVFALRASKAE